MFAVVTVITLDRVSRIPGCEVDSKGPAARNLLQNRNAGKPIEKKVLVKGSYQK